MIRNKTPELIQAKHRIVGRKFTTNKDIMVYQPWWFQQYYNQKQTLALINSNNRNITILTKQYQVNPSVYTLKQVEKLITDNCQLIESVDRWTGSFKYSPLNTATYKNEKTLTMHLQTLLAEEIMNVFQNKQIISSVNNEIDQQNSFNKSRNYGAPSMGHNPNNSFTSPNPLDKSFDGQDRNAMFQQVSAKIQNLNIVMRRMNALVAGQGELINRIDENLMTGKENMVKANQQLNKRVQKQQGTGQFSLEGKVNKVITGLYIINLIIILLFVLKHLIF